MRAVVKRSVQALFLLIALPAALLCGFGRVFGMYTLFAQAFALVPGFPGQFCRAAFYRLTLQECSQDIAVHFGSYFSRPDACVGANVSIGAYCVIGCARIGERTQVSSHVEIPGGRHQHGRDAEGRLAGDTVDSPIVIGPHCWIGASAIVLADIGWGTTVGAGSVVVKPLPERAVAVGNPARVIRAAAEA